MRTFCDPLQLGSCHDYAPSMQAPSPLAVMDQRLAARMCGLQRSGRPLRSAAPQCRPRCCRSRGRPGCAWSAPRPPSPQSAPRWAAGAARAQAGVGRRRRPQAAALLSVWPLRVAPDTCVPPRPPRTVALTSNPMSEPYPVLVAHDGQSQLASRMRLAMCTCHSAL